MQIIMNVFSGIIGYMVRYFQDRSIQKKKFNFDAAIMSYTSKKVFDKYTEFCEKYIHDFYEIFNNLWKTASLTKTAEELRKRIGENPLLKLMELRHRYIIWIPEKINKELIDIENLLWKGIYTEEKVKWTQPYSSEKKEAIQSAYNMLFKQILAVSDKPEEIDKESAYEQVLSALKKVLMTEKLFKYWKDFS